ncbi:MAG TPA: hypothetical protein VFA70_15910, partial [Dehalococcoidia bacterium]|nr:hypothetical protein [Dehalococcoidia bacterium]
DDCAAGLARFTAAIEEQFAASRVLAAALDDGDTRAEPEPVQPVRPPSRTRPGPRRLALIRRHPRAVAGFGALAAALLLLGLLLARANSGGGAVSAGRRPEFVPSLQVLPQRLDNTYFAGEQVQVCLTINQPSRVRLSVLEGNTTFPLYDAETAPGSHCFPERITSSLRTRATLRVEVYFGTERVAREDIALLPATPTPAP